MFDNFFQGSVFLYFTKLVAVIHCIDYTVFILEQHLQPWIVYTQCIWQIFLLKAYCNFKGAHAAIHLSGAAILSGSHLQRVLSFFEISTSNALCLQKYGVNSPPVAAIHSMNDPFSIIKE